MDRDVVVVIALNTGEEVLAILLKKMKSKVRVEYPSYVKYTAGGTSLALYPYCAFSDETVFDIKMSEIRYLVTASSHIADRFLNHIDSIELEKTRVEDYVDTNEQAQELLKIIESIPSLQEKQPEPEPPKNIDPGFVEGNKTKH